MQSEFASLNTIQLRQEVRTRGLANGPAVSAARKGDLLALLEGKGSLPQPEALPTAPAAGGDLADVIAKALSGKVGADENRIAAMIDTALARFADEDLPGMIEGAKPTGGMVINFPELPQPIELEGQTVHRQFPQVLAWIRADVPVWLWGAPGAGKTHLGRQIAAAMGLECYTMSIDETTTANKLLGFQNLVSGEYVQGWLYKPYKDGGLVVIDEIDTGNPGILAGLNALIANGHYLFPNGETVERNPKFRVLACANTNGTGAIAGFTARTRLDAATLNRFAQIRLEYDEGLELALTCGIPSESEPWRPTAPARPEDCQKWVEWIQEARKYFGDRVLISPRPSILGVKALQAGIPSDEVAAALVFALCADDTKSAIVNKVGSPDAIHARTDAESVRKAG